LGAFGAQEEEGQNLGVHQHPGQCATQPIGGVLQQIGLVSHPISLLLQLLVFGGLDLLFREPLGGYYYCIGWQPIFDIIGVFFQICRTLVQGSIYYLNKGQI
jgi:hypothetical protein